MRLICRIEFGAFADPQLDAEKNCELVKEELKKAGRTIQGTLREEIPWMDFLNNYGEQSLDIFEVSVKELTDVRYGITLPEVYEYAANHELNFQVLPKSATYLIAIKFTKQLEGEMHYIATEPFNSSGREDCEILPAIGNTNGQLWLRSECGAPHHPYYPESKFLFGAATLQ
jgi:hypothetical protein